MADMHPLDAAEIALKQAARTWRDADQNGIGTASTPRARDDSWQELKEAARSYGEAWRVYVVTTEGTEQP